MIRPAHYVRASILILVALATWFIVPLIEEARSRRRRIVGTVAPTIAGLAILVTGVGCTGNPDQDAYAALTRSADRFVNETVGPEYLDLVQANPDFAPEERRVRINNVEAFRRAVQSARDNLGRNGS